MNKIEVVNIKCSGCKKTIIKNLELAGFTKITVSDDLKIIKFKGADLNLARKILLDLGYPEKGSPDEKSFLKKIKSLGSCAIGKFAK